MDEDDMGFTDDEIEEISNDDEDYEHLKTKKRYGSLSSQQLLERIETDPNHETFRQYPLTGVLVYPFILFVVGFPAILAVVLLFGGITGQSNLDAAVSVTVIVSLFGACYFCMMGIERHLYRIVVNSEGIGERGEYGNTAIEWTHIDYVDIWWRGERVFKIEFTGNRRSFWVQSSPLGKKFGLSELVRYIPDFDNWEKVRRERWRRGVVRYIRPRSLDD